MSPSIELVHISTQNIHASFCCKEQVQGTSTILENLGNKYLNYKDQGTKFEKSVKYSYMYISYFFHNALGNLKEYSKVKEYEYPKNLKF